MPFKSTAQRGWMFANEPEMARRWAKHTPKGKKLPRHVHEEPADDVNLALPDPEEVGLEFKKKASVHAVRMPDVFTVRTLEGELQGKAGDFLCKGSEDELWPVDYEIFMKAYAPVPPKMSKVFQQR